MIHYGERTDFFCEEVLMLEGDDMKDLLTFEERANRLTENVWPTHARVSARAQILASLQSAFQRGHRKGQEEERERCAQIAKAHKGSAAKKRGKIKSNPFMSDDAHDGMVTEIYAEERGEDIASEMIETAIRALPLEGEKP